MAERQDTNMTNEDSYTYESVTDSEDGMETVPAQPVAQPMMAQPMMGQPMMGQPMMGQPIMGQPMGQPMMQPQLAMGVGPNGQPMMVQLSPEALQAALAVQHHQQGGMAPMGMAGVPMHGQSPSGQMGNMQIEIHLNQDGQPTTPKPEVELEPQEPSEDSIEVIQPQLTMTVGYETAKDRERAEWEKQERCNRFAFCIAIMVFVVPIALTLFDLYTDWVLVSFIGDVSTTYDGSLQTIRSDLFVSNPAPMIIADCIGGGNTSSDFPLYTFIKTPRPFLNCSCTLTPVLCPVGGAVGLGNPFNATASNYPKACAAPAPASNITCDICDCGLRALYHPRSPQIMFAEAGYPGIVFGKDTAVCDVPKMRTFAQDENIDTTRIAFGHEYRACWAFFVLAAVVQLCAITTAFKVRFNDIRRTWGTLNWEPPDPDAESRTVIEQDSFTMLVLFLILAHAVEDVPQSVIAVFFSIDKQRRYGADCFQRLASQGFNYGVPPIGPDLNSPWFFLFNDAPMTLFVAGAFINVFVSGTMAVRALGFEQEKMRHYKWYHWTFYVLGSLFLGVFALFIVLAPMFGAIWWTGADVNLVGGASTTVKWVSVAGLVFWVIVCCLPCCFCGQLGDAAGCDGGCGDCGCAC